MTLRQHARLRTIAAGSVLGLAAGTAAVLGTASSASAQSVTFTCTTLLGDKVFESDLSASPAKVPVGGQIRPTVTAVMTVPDDLAGMLRLIGAAKTSGTVSAPLVVGGVAKTAELVIPESAVPASGPIPLKASGKLGVIKGTKVGTTIPIRTNGPTVVMNLLKEDGTEAIEPQTVPCVTSTGSPVAAGKIKVVKATSKSKVSATYAKKSKKATVKSKVTTNGAKATGKVTFVAKLGKKKVATKKVAIKNNVAKAVFKLKKKGKYTIKATYPGTAKVTGSKGNAKVTAK